MAKSGIIYESGNRYKFEWELIGYNEDDCTKTLSYKATSLQENLTFNGGFKGLLTIASFTDSVKVGAAQQAPSVKLGANNGDVLCSGTFKIPDRTTNFTLAFSVYSPMTTSFMGVDYTVTESYDIQDAFIYDSGKTVSGVGEENSIEVSSYNYLGFSWEIISRDIDKNLVYFNYKIYNNAIWTSSFYGINADLKFRTDDGTIFTTKSLVSNLNKNNIVAGGTIATGSFSVQGYIDDTRANICYMDLNVRGTDDDRKQCYISDMRWRYRNVPHPSGVSVTASTIGDFPPFVFTKKHEEAVSTLTYRFGNLTGTIVSNFSGTNYNEWQVPEEFYYQMTNSRQMNCILTCTSTLRGEQLGSSESTLLILVRESEAKPKLNSFTVVDSNPKTISATGNSNKFIQNASIAQYTVDATGMFGASIDSIRVLNANGPWNTSSYSTGASGTIQPISEVINHSSYDYLVTPFCIIVTDSRGLTSQFYIYKEVIEYEKPTLQSSIGQMTGTGEISVGASGTYYNKKVGSKTNSVSASYRYKLKGGTYSSWANISTTNNSSTGEYYANSVVSNLDYQAKYIFQIRITDCVSEIYSEEFQAVSIPVFDWSNSDFNFNVPVAAPQINIPQGGLYVNGVQINFDEVPEEDPSKSVECGTWTPNVLDFTISTSNCSYMRVGNMVTISWYIYGTAVGSGYTVVIASNSLPYEPNGIFSGGGHVEGVTIPANSCFSGWYLNTSGLYARTTYCNATDSERVNIGSGYCEYSGSTPYTATLSGTLMYTTDE